MDPLGQGKPASAGEHEMLSALENLNGEKSSDEVLKIKQVKESEGGDKVDETMNKNGLSLGDKGAGGKRRYDKASKLATLSKFLSVAVKGSEGQKKILTKKGYGEFLVFCLMDDSVGIVRAAMEVLEVLMLNRRNHSLLRELAYFMSVLESFEKKRGIPEDIKKDASKIRQTLNECKMPLSDRWNVADNSTRGTSSVMERSKNTNGVQTVFCINYDVLQQAYARNRISNSLIQIPGIISVTYNPAKGLCIVRKKRNVDDNLFGTSIAKLGYEVSIMRRSRTKDWVLVPVRTEAEDTTCKENIPQYLPEEDEEPPVGENAISKPGVKARENETSLLGSARNFLARSFFW